MNKPFIVAIIVIVVLLGAGLFMALNRSVAIPESLPGAGSTSTEEEVTFCTMDAKMCPDGSSVGRVAPSCEFAACPGE